MQNDHVLGAVMRSKAQLAYCADSIAQRAPQLKVVFRAAAAYDTADTWKMVVASIVITVGYVVCIAVVHYVAQYLRDRRTPVYCVNMRLPQKFHDHKFTTAMVEKLQNTPEYRRLKQQRMHQGPEAWNWQTRQRMGERMPSDDMSDEEF
ncbi:uncharacterized protein BcabD6B2_30800 [Babesia caballi]|uniref:Transmembrane protein, putative n=1 Tax=Babesia caballi TaxID=5871 RepID=A0AAV4LVM2_BABCB|nr:transmembrane protein, putative [Babesia caballi]